MSKDESKAKVEHEVASFKIENVQCVKLIDNLTIVRNAINIKYGVNGLGKSSIGKAIEAFFIQDEKKKKTEYAKLVPFKDKKLKPAIELKPDKCFKGCAAFNRDYINNFLFKDSATPNTKEKFLSNKEINDISKKIEGMLEKISSSINDERNPLKTFKFKDVSGQFISEGRKFKKDDTLHAAFKDGAALSLDNPEILQIFHDFLEMKSYPSWFIWRNDVNPEWLENGICPYCGQPIDKEKINQINDSFEEKNSSVDSSKYKKGVEIMNDIKSHAKNINDKKIIDKFLESKDAPSESVIGKIYTINLGIQNQIKKIDFWANVVKNYSYAKINSSDFINEIKNNKLNLEYFKSFKNDVFTKNAFKKAAENLNLQIKSLLKEQKKLSSLITNLNAEIEKAIQDNRKSINDFLTLSGIPYRFYFDNNSCDKTYIRAMVSDNENDDVECKEPTSHLSYGELNSLSLALFGAMAKNSPEDLIILDDPISSFDDNKKFAVMHYLFNNQNGVLKDKTVLMLTHDFEPVIDLVYRDIACKGGKEKRNAYLLYKDDKGEGIIKEKKIEKEEIISSYKKDMDIVRNTKKDLFLRLYHLRRIIDMDNIPNDNVYKVISGAIKLFEYPVVDENNMKKYINKKDKEIAENIINDYLGKDTFKYKDFYQKYSDLTILKSLYESPETTEQEKFAVLRTLLHNCNFRYKNKYNYKGSIVWAKGSINHFLDESYHPENDALFTLRDSKEVPVYLLKERESLYKEVCEQIKNHSL